MGLPPNWDKYTTDDGKEYYHNSKTNVTQWDPPPEEPNNMESVYKPDLNDLDLHSTMSAPSDPAKATQSTKLAVTAPIVPQGNMSSMASTRSDSATASLTRNVDGESSMGAKAWYARLCTCITIEKYQPYFDLSTNEFIERLKLAANPLAKSAVDLSEKPDFYGPFWIVTTAVIFLSGTANFGNILIADEGAKVLTDWNLVYISATMVYGSLILVPLLVSLVLRLSGVEKTPGDAKLGIAQFICVWGYSFTWLIPCALLCVIPSDLVKWIVVGISLMASCLFVRNNLWQDMGVDLPNTRYALIALLFGSHAVIYIMYRLYFLSHTHASPEVAAALELQHEKDGLLAAAAGAGSSSTGGASAAASADGGDAANAGAAEVVEAAADGARRLLAYMMG